MTTEENIDSIKEAVSREKIIAIELDSLVKSLKHADEEERKMIDGQMKKLGTLLKQINKQLLGSLEGASLERMLEDLKPKEEKKIQQELNKDVSQNIRSILEGVRRERPEDIKESMSELDKGTLKRIKKGKEKVEVKKIKKASVYVKLANGLFGNTVKRMIQQNRLKTLERDLIKSNLSYPPVTYISILILTTIVSVAVAVFVFTFFLFFNISPDLPIITISTEAIGSRFLKIFFILFVVPFGTFMFMYFYPSMEKKSLENKINMELPFATIHMSAIAGSLIEPIKVFNIISATKEYPNLEREFNKLLNEINIYGYDIVTALKDVATNCPSSKLAELFNGLATTITSGGDFYDFFDKRSQSLLFEYRLEREKNTKSAETFMDIYISVVIAAPMILMLLLMTMKISGLGISVSTNMLTFLIVAGVALINFFFLIFLQLKQPEVI